jgi:hypothetical protein
MKVVVTSKKRPLKAFFYDWVEVIITDDRDNKDK